MRTLRTSLLLASLLAPAALSLMPSGCATTSNAPAATTQVELDGSKWKLRTFLAKLDGRVIQFQKGGSGTYMAKLVEPGVALRDRAGVEGMTVFTLSPTGTMNEYRGYFTSIGSEGGSQQQEVIVTVFNEDELRWNLDSSWSRVRD
jgi:hypothetical protein